MSNVYVNKHHGIELSFRRANFCVLIDVIIVMTEICLTMYYRDCVTEQIIPESNIREISNTNSVLINSKTPTYIDGIQV